MSEVPPRGVKQAEVVSERRLFRLAGNEWQKFFLSQRVFDMQCPIFQNWKIHKMAKEVIHFVKSFMEKCAGSRPIVVWPSGLIQKLTKIVYKTHEQKL